MITRVLLAPAFALLQHPAVTAAYDSVAQRIELLNRSAYLVSENHSSLFVPEWGGLWRGIIFDIDDMPRESIIAVLDYMFAEIGADRVRFVSRSPDIGFRYGARYHGLVLQKGEGSNSWEIDRSHWERRDVA